jgi:hypothetical protein
MSLCACFLIDPETQVPLGPERGANDRNQLLHAVLQADAPIL